MSCPESADLRAPLEEMEVGQMLANWVQWAVYGTVHGQGGLEHYNLDALFCSSVHLLSVVYPHIFINNI